MRINDRATTAPAVPFHPPISTPSDSPDSTPDILSLTPDENSPEPSLTNLVPSPESTGSEESTGASRFPEVTSCSPPSVSHTTNGFHMGSSATSSTHLSVSNLYPPARPQSGCGTLGWKIPLKINFFEMKLPQNSLINQYRVDITFNMASGDERAVIQKHVCKSVWKALLKKYAAELQGKHPVYDGRATLYARELLWNGSPRKFEIDWEDEEDGGRKRTNTVKIAHTGSVDLSLLQEFINRQKPYETAETRQTEFDLGRSAIQVIEVILSQLPKSRYNTIGRSHYFDPGNNQVSLGQGCDIWEGYYQSLRPGTWKPFINIDVTYTAMIQDTNVIDFILDLTNSRYPEDAVRGRNLGEVKSHLCGLKVSTRHMGYNRVYKLSNEKRKILGKSASEHKFDLGDGSTTSIEKYYLNKYKIKLQCPYLPLLAVGSKGTTLLPMELCTIVRGQHKKGKLTADQTSEMIRSAAKPADKRMWNTEDIAKRELVPTPLLDYYGIKINPRMYETEGRVLDAPKLRYQNKEVSPRDGSWDLRGVKFKNGMKLDNWVILDFVGIREDTFYKFLDELKDVGRNSGVMISDPLTVKSPQINSKDDDFRKISQIEKEFDDLHKKYNPTMFMLFINEKKPYPLPNKDMYKHIKRICDSDLGVLSQCIKDKNIFKANKSVLANICLKINAKLGGVNHDIDTSNTSFGELFKKPIMFIGADVNHPHVGMDEVMPSIAAAVGSIDSKLAKYVSSVRFQKHSRSVESKNQVDGMPKKKERLEMIDKFDDMCYELISAFRENCKGRLPERIIYYRDGVSEGQFRAVLNREMTSMRRACRRFSPDYQPGITIVCVQKRHHLRMFCRDRGCAVGKGNNVPPGCVLDKDVTHPVEFDFYLCSHFGLQGTSRPTHYHVLWDDNNFDSDSLQTLTYHLCHLYARCTKAVSIPAPVYYAHWVALRAMNSTNFEDDASSIRSEGSDEHNNWDEKRKPMLIRKGLMYWA
ncbi:argonaute 1 [Oopsacas minuta]|uniref:Argonaute 1 n=1 Tax=Oopsacas minuta TaxID=111878 RepID=A0A1W5RSP4_9METZ|nr:argonaute 1 [Oopsacas minuta]KAI6654721.1 argonaute 1 [Oopsacas minuta]